MDIYLKEGRKVLGGPFERRDGIVKSHNASLLFLTPMMMMVRIAWRREGKAAVRGMRYIVDQMAPGDNEMTKCYSYYLLDMFFFFLLHVLDEKVLLLLLDSVKHMSKHDDDDESFSLSAWKLHIIYILTEHDAFSPPFDALRSHYCR